VRLELQTGLILSAVITSRSSLLRPVRTKPLGEGRWRPARGRYLVKPFEEDDLLDGIRPALQSEGSAPRDDAARWIPVVSARDGYQAKYEAFGGL